jgi:hypothetical protein
MPQILCLATGNSASTLTRRLSAVLACACAVVVLAACGSGGGTQSASGGSADGSGSSGTLGTVTIGKAVDTIGFTTVDVAEGEGYFAKEGVKVSDDW